MGRTPEVVFCFEGLGYSRMPMSWRFGGWVPSR